MVVNTWDGAANTNWDDAANWDSTGVTDRIPTASDVVIIPDTSSINNPTLRQNQPCASFDMQANATVVGAGFKITVHEEDSNVAVDNDAIISGVLDLEIQTAGATTLDLMGTSGNFRNLTINHASCDAFLIANTAIDGNLTITLGKLTCTTDGGSARTLTVGGYTSIGPSRGSADQATLTATSQDLLIGSGRTSSHALIITQGGTFVGGTGIHTIGSLNIKNSVYAKCTLTSGVTTLNGEHAGDNYAINIEGSNGNTNFAHGSGTVTITHDGASDIKADGVTLALNNLIINHASANINLKGILTVAGNLTITAGELDTDSSNYALTVTGDTTGAGTLTLNNSTYTGGGSGSHLAMLGTVTIGTSGVITGVDELGTVSGSGSTITATGSPTLGHRRLRQLQSKWTPATSTLKLEDGTNAIFGNDGTYAIPYNFEFDNSGNTVELSGNFTVTNNLTITAGTLTTSGSNYALTVTGDMLVSAAGTFTGNSSAVIMRSLEISGAGTFSAPDASGSCTITGRKAGTSRCTDIGNNTNNFTGNSGTLTFTSSNGGDLTGIVHLADADELYNMTINSSGQTFDIAAQAMTANGDVLITAGTLNADTADVSFGSLTIASGGTYSATSGTTTVTGALVLVSGGTLTENASGLITCGTGTDIQQALTTVGNWTLTGDCEFDAVTVSSGDTLDLNGQRMVTSGTLSLVDGSHFDASGGSFAYCNNFDNATTGTITTDDNSYLILTGAGVSADWQTNSKAPFRNLMINSAGTVTANGNQDIDSDMEKVIIGAGTLTTSGSNYDVNASDMTIATGGILTANGSDITVAGDFTTSGGLLGASCLNLADNYYGVNATATTWGFTSAYTIEMWFKTGTDSGTMRLLDLYDTVQDNNIDRVYLRLRSSDDQVRFGTYDSSDDHDGMETAGIDCNDGKWHHLAVTCSGTVKQIYYDGKLNASKTVGVTRSGDTAMKLYVGADKDGANKFTGQIEELRIFSDVRTEAEIRADMFQGGTLANSGNLTARHSFNEGTGTAVDNSETTAARDLVLTNASSWAGAGTFTYGTSTLVMSGSSKKLTCLDDFTLYNFTASGTITIDDAASTIANLDINNALNASGTLSSTNNETISLKLSGNTVAVGTAATSLASLYALRVRRTSNLNLPELTTPRIMLETSGGTVTATGDLTITEELELSSGTTFNANGNTIVAKEVDVNGTGTLNLSNSTLDFSVTSSGDTLSIEATGTLTTGNTTITGHTGQQTPAVLPYDGDFEVVGDISDLKIMSGGDLTVVGLVTNCLLQDSTANIRQWHHTLDTQQLLDADSAGDDDLKLTKPALDNAHELQTG